MNSLYQHTKTIGNRYNKEKIEFCKMFHRKRNNFLEMVEFFFKCGYFQHNDVFLSTNRRNCNSIPYKSFVSTFIHEWTILIYNKRDRLHNTPYKTAHVETLLLVLADKTNNNILHLFNSFLNSGQRPNSIYRPIHNQRKQQAYNKLVYKTHHFQ